MPIGLSLRFPMNVLLLRRTDDWEESYERGRVLENL